MTASRAPKHRAPIASLIRCAVAVVLATLLGGCNSTESEVQKVVIDNLQGKASYRFGTLTEVNGLAACQTVNTATADGRETGDMQAFVVKKGDTWYFLRFIQAPHEECVQAAAEVVAARSGKG
ncbi:hypothetical protein PSm6_30740 [Pseudomonas solani]|uniref:Lipoprotein n=1 Tax=Pseudomonas solani TaxID=2731552 RepID=A0AAU7Y8I6_9PSED|nr:hypothetical protein [Pseudomonas solani]EQM69358.1 hypothetical protein L682_13785 [Pseudomonas alcaligenes OT 69]MDN4146139.1 hypothetical protein [Pseudomonas tohonis]BCD86667.1 hypothetical protein PSm6_30740 [Pseudomonas solani]